MRGVAENIEVTISPEYDMSDAEIAKNVLDTLRWHTSVPNEKIFVKVDDGIVTLDGEVNWDFQRRAAKEAISSLAGIRLVNNNLVVKPVISPADIKKRISDAMHRMASIDASQINVEVSGTRVNLTGSVRSIPEREDAISAAWSAPGITEVQQSLIIEQPEYSFEE